MKLKKIKSSVINLEYRKFLKLFTWILCIAATVSGCAYNNNAINKNLTKTQANKLNGIMFSILNIPALNIASATENIKYKKHKVLYIPKTMLGISKINKAITAKLKHSKKLDAATLKNKNMYKTDLKQNKLPKTKQALKTIQVSPARPYTLTKNNNTIYLKISTKKKMIIHKKIIVDHLSITIRGFRYINGYEIVFISLTNNGNTKFINLNFKYSNAGNSFRIKKWEIIKNLTVANKYKKGVIFWLNF
jgi:hypothetical protein